MQKATQKVTTNKHTQAVLERIQETPADTQQSPTYTQKEPNILVKRDLCVHQKRLMYTQTQVVSEIIQKTPPETQ